MTDDVDPLPTDVETLRTELVLMMWSHSMMRRAFGDLAVAFATVDREAAVRAINAGEKRVVADLIKLRDEPAEGIVQMPVEALKSIAASFREMSQGALADIKKAAKPN